MRQSGSRQEFDRFVAESAESLLRAATLVVWDPVEAEDLVQECFYRLARRWPRVRRMEHPRAYARKVLVNLALDAGRRRHRQRAELDLDEGGMDVHEDVHAVRLLGRVEAQADLDRAMGDLAPRQRAALVLRYFEDLTEAQTADVMGCTVGTVKSTTARALERLRAHVGLHDHESPEKETKEGSVIT